MDKDVVIRKINETYVSVLCKEQYIEMEISDRFSFETPNANFDPRVKYGKWDGVIKLYNRTHKRMYLGLLFELVKFLNKQGYSYSVDPDLINKSQITDDELKELISEVIKPHDNGQPIVPYDYQNDAVRYMLNSSRSICLAATSAGKSLALYLAIRIYQLDDSFDDKKIVVIVPSTMLVEQLYSDFDNYSSYDGSNWMVGRHCQKITGAYSKNISKQIVISTWQSLKNMRPDTFDDVGAIFVDECHTVKGPILASVLEGATSVSVRHGLTGTLDSLEANQLAAQGLLGPAKLIVTAKQIIDAGRATEVEVHCMILDYDNNVKIAYNKDQSNIADESPTVRYQSELNFINNLECRKKFIHKLVKSLKGNTIVLFNRVDEYGIPLYEAMKEVHENTFLIVGDVKGSERERIKQLLEELDDAVLFATDTIMSTGISIKNLHNMIFASSSKSKIKVLQSIGRLMRLHGSKLKAYMFDLVDKLDFNGKDNMTLRHVEERIKFYSNEQFKVKFSTYKLVEPDKDRVTLM